jgi:hypothetical protein
MSSLDGLCERARCCGRGEDQLRGGMGVVVGEAEVPAIEVEEEIGEDQETYKCDSRQENDKEKVRLLRG